MLDWSNGRSNKSCRSSFGSTRARAATISGWLVPCVALSGEDPFQVGGCFYNRDDSYTAVGTFTAGDPGCEDDSGWETSGVCQFKEVIDALAFCSMSPSCVAVVCESAWTALATDCMPSAGPLVTASPDGLSRPGPGTWLRSSCNSNAHVSYSSGIVKKSSGQVLTGGFNVEYGTDDDTGSVRHPKLGADNNTGSVQPSKALIDDADGRHAGPVSKLRAVLRDKPDKPATPTHEPGTSTQKPELQTEQSHPWWDPSGRVSASSPIHRDGGDHAEQTHSQQHSKPQPQSQREPQVEQQHHQQPQPKPQQVHSQQHSKPQPQPQRESQHQQQPQTPSPVPSPRPAHVKADAGDDSEEGRGALVLFAPMFYLLLGHSGGELMNVLSSSSSHVRQDHRLPQLLFFFAIAGTVFGIFPHSVIARSKAKGFAVRGFNRARSEVEGRFGMARTNDGL